MHWSGRGRSYPGQRLGVEGNTTSEQSELAIEAPPQVELSPGTASAVVPGRPRRSELRRRRLRRTLLEWVVVVVVALGVAVLTRTFVAQTFYIPSGSMSPTLQVGDRIVVNKLYGTIHRGDIIVFRRVAKDPQTQYADLVKRVIGLPGQTISSKANTIYINGRAIAQPWLPRLTGICAEQSANIRTQVIPARSYFVMGDCRGDSYDSRYWGTVPASHVIGKVVAIVWRHGHPWIHWF